MSPRWSRAGGVTLAHDPLGRLYSLSDGTTTRLFLYDGDTLFGEYATNGAPLMFYGHGPDVDEPVMWFDYSTFEFGTFHGDERGSVVASVAAGGTTTLNRYDDYGNPQGGAISGRFGYTGQVWLQQAGLYHYRARAYNPALGRFMQTDPIGYGDGMNLYAYVGNNPVNRTDPSGLDQEVVVIGRRPLPQNASYGVHYHGHATSPGLAPQEPDFERWRGEPGCPPPQVDMSREGNVITLTGNIAVQSSANSPAMLSTEAIIPSNDAILPGLDQAAIGTINGLSRQYGSIDLRVRMSLGGGGLTLFIGPRAGSETAPIGGSQMSVGRLPAGEGLNSPFMGGFLKQVRHSFMHNMGYVDNPLSPLMGGQSGGGPFPLPSEVEEWAARCTSAQG